MAIELQPVGEDAPPAEAPEEAPETPEETAAPETEAPETAPEPAPKINVMDDRSGFQLRTQRR